MAPGEDLIWHISDFQIPNYFINFSPPIKSVVVRMESVTYFNKANEKLTEVNISHPKAWIKNSENNNIKISYEYSTSVLNETDSTISVLPDSVIYITDDSLKSNDQTYGNTFNEIIKSNVLIIIGALVIILVSLFLYLRISIIREKKKIKKEQENNQKFWEKLLEDDK